MSLECCDTDSCCALASYLNFEATADSTVAVHRRNQMMMYVWIETFTDIMTEEEKEQGAKKKEECIKTCTFPFTSMKNMD